jgi:hypothetical protein
MNESLLLERELWVFSPENVNTPCKGVSSLKLPVLRNLPKPVKKSVWSYPTVSAASNRRLLIMDI